MTWRDLNSNEQPQTGDRYITSHGIEGRYMRPVPEPQWIAISERLPRKDEYPVVVWSGEKYGTAVISYDSCRHELLNRPCCDHRTVDFDRSVTHWRSFPPLPQKDGSEEAFKSIVKELSAIPAGTGLEAFIVGKQNLRQLWDAALAWAKKEEKA